MLKNALIDGSAAIKAKALAPIKSRTHVIMLKCVPTPGVFGVRDRVVFANLLS